MNMRGGTVGVHMPSRPRGFERLVAIVKEQGFSDRKLLVIEAASLGGWFTSGQCAALMSEFDFDEKKLDVLRLLAPRLTDTCDLFRHP